MTRKVIFSCLFMLGVLCPLPSMAAVYEGGSGGGWAYLQANAKSGNYYGGIGDGNYVSASAASTLGYAAASKLVFTTQPGVAYAATAFGTQPVVKVEDQYNNTVPNSDSVGLSIVPGSGTAGSTLSGTTPVTAVSGVATFSGMSISNNGTGFILAAADGGLSGNSTAFNATSGVQITAPNGGENWTVGTPNNITWNSYGLVNSTDTATISYSLNGGSTYTSISANAVSPYSWTTPASTSSQALVQIVSNDSTNSTKCTSGSSNCTSTSAAVFSLLGGFSINAPNTNGTDIWANGFAHTISWYTQGVVNNVNLYYSPDGSTWNTIATSYANNSNGALTTYSWTPNLASTVGGSKYAIKVADASNPTKAYQVSANFTAQTIGVTAPTSALRVQAGTSTPIAWNSGGISNVQIQYQIGAAAPVTIASSVLATASTGSSCPQVGSTGCYTWAVPGNFTPSTNVTVIVSSASTDSVGNTASSTSSAFTVNGVLTINGAGDQPSASGISMPSGQPYTITWTTTEGSIANVKLEYSNDSFAADDHVIVASTSNCTTGPPCNGTYSWTPTITGNGVFKIRVSDVNDSQDNSVSTNPFSVTGVNVSAPSSGVTWPCGSSQSIVWNYVDATATSFKVQYSIDNGSTWTVINSSTTANAGLAWTVPLTPSSTAKVQVIANDSTTGTTAAFNIPAALSMPTPPTLNVGDTYSITWTNTGTVNSVNLQYSTNSGSAWTTIASNCSTTSLGGCAGNSYSWTVPDAINNNLTLLKVSDADSTVNGIPVPASSAQSAAFSIQSKMAVTSPASAASWAVSDPGKTIVWTTTGTVSKVNLLYSINSGSTWTAISSISNSTGGGSYAWNLMPDLVLAALANPQASKDPSVPVQIKIQDADSASPQNSSAAVSFNAIYYTTTWDVEDGSGGGFMSELGVSENDPSAWSVASGSSGLSSPTTTWHNDPYGTYTTTWYANAGIYTGSNLYSNATDSGWLANQDQTITVKMYLASLAATPPTPNSDFTYANGIYEINAWLESSGKNVTDSLSCSVAFTDPTGTYPSIPALTTSSFSYNSTIGVCSAPWTPPNTSSTFLGTVTITDNTTGKTYSLNTIYSISNAALGTLPAAVSALQSTANTISANTTGLSGLPGAISALQSTANTISSNVNGLSSEMATLQSTDNTISSNTAGLSVLPGEMTTLESTANTISSNVSGLSSEMTTLQSTANTISSNVNGLSSEMATLQSTANTISSNVNGLSGLSASMVTLQSTANTISSNVNGLSATNATILNDVTTISNTINTLSGLSSQITTLQTQLNTLTPTLNNLTALVGTASDSAGANSIFGKIASINSNITPLVNNWGTITPQTLVNDINSSATTLGNPNDPCGVLSVFGKINCVYNQGGNVASVSALANQTFNLIQQLQQQLGTSTPDTNGKSETVYDMLQKLNDYMNQMKSSAGTISQGALAPLSQSVQAARQKLQTAAAGAGITGTGLNPVKPSAVTLDNLHQQLLQLQQMTQAVKNTVQSNEGPKVKAWFENGAVNQ